MPRKVTKEVLERMKKLKEKGLTYGEIAEKIGISRPSVTMQLKRKRKRTRTKITSEILEKMICLRKQGFARLEDAP